MTIYPENSQTIAIPRMIWRLLPHKKKRTAVRLWLMMVFGMFLELLGVGLVVPIILLFSQHSITTIADKYPVLHRVLESLGNPSQRVLILAAMLILVSVYVLKNIYLAFLAWTQSKFSYGLEAEMSKRLFTIYLRQPYTFHLQRNSAQLIRNMGEIGIFISNAVTPSQLLLAEGMVMLGLCSLLLIIQPVGTIFVAMVLGIFAFIFQRITKKYVSKWGAARQYHEGLRLQHLKQGLGGAKDVKLMGREDEFLNQYGIHTNESTLMFQRQHALMQMPRLWLEVLGVVGLSSLVVSMMVQGQEFSTVLPTLGLFAAAAFRMMPSINRMLSASQQIRFSHSSIGMLYKELNLANVDYSGAVRSKDTALFQDEIKLKNITYTYPGANAPSLLDISLSIKKGESVGFIGPSGSGKSTLVDVILGLLVSDKGKYFVDSKDIMEDPRWWQDQIGYVPQSIYLTDDSLRHNVAFGIVESEIDDDAVNQALSAAQLDEFIMDLSDGVNTVIGERGVRLSGGQRQRIGIARALYHNPSVLVLDEATSALDKMTEEGVMQAVLKLQRSKTIIIVAHRLSTVSHCDRLYRLEKGRIVEVGQPGEILKASDAAK